MTYSNRSRVSQRVRNAVASLAFGALLVAVPDTALAKGTINAVTASPTNPLVGQVVTITVKGSGTCGLLQIAYGDGTKILYNNVEFQGGKVAATKKYMTAGAKSVQVKGKAACSGSASTQVQVQPKPNNGGDLEVRRHDPGRVMKLNDPATLGLGNKGVLQLLKPTITGYFATPLGAATNGTKVFLKGQGFGTKKGEIRMFLGGGPSMPLTQLEWLSATNVRGVIQIPVLPPGIGCGSDKVEFQVVTAAKSESNKWKTAWKQGGKQKTVQLKATDPVIKVLQCGKDANWNACNTKGSQNYVDWSPTTLDTSGTGCDQTKSICSWHKNQWGAVGTDKGTDKYQIKLKNNWKFTWVNFSSKKSSNDEKINGPYPKLYLGESEWSPSWNWSVTSGDELSYEATLKITGPEACPYH